MQVSWGNYEGARCTSLEAVTAPLHERSAYMDKGRERSLREQEAVLSDALSGRRLILEDSILYPGAARA